MKVIARPLVRNVLVGALALVAALGVLIAWSFSEAEVASSGAGPGGVQDQLKLEGRVNIEVYGSDGKLKDKRDVRNTILDYGKEGVLIHLFSALYPNPPGQQASTLFVTYTALAVGNGAVVPADPDLLANELFRLNRVTQPQIDPATNCVSQTFQRGVTAATEVYREAGLATTAAAGFQPLLNRVTFADVTKIATDTVFFTMTICIP